MVVNTLLKVFPFFKTLYVPKSTRGLFLKVMKTGYTPVKNIPSKKARELITTVDIEIFLSAGI